MRESPVKILYPFEGASVGGSVVSGLEIITSLNAKNFSAICLVHCPDGPLVSYLQEKNIAFKTLPLFVPHSLKAIITNPICFMRSISAAYLYIKRNKIDIVQIDDGPLRYIWFYAVKLAGSHFVLTQRTLLKQNIEKKITYRYMDAIVSNSKVCQSTLPALPSRVVQELSYPNIKSPKIIAEDNDHKRQIIGYLANIHIRKRPELFVDVAHILNSKYPEQFDFIMAGGYANNMEEKIKRKISNLGLEDNISLLGFVNDPLPLLSTYHILVAPSVEEAFGRNLVEAMSMGIPVVATDDGGHKEIIEDGVSGFLVEKENAEMFAEKIFTLLSEETYNKVSIAATERSKKFCDNSPALLLEDIYNKVLSN